jgi:hypothetical protein
VCTHCETRNDFESYYYYYIKLICKNVLGHGHTAVANPNLVHTFFFIFNMKTFE